MKRNGTFLVPGFPPSRQMQDFLECVKYKQSVKGLVVARACMSAVLLL